MKSGFKWLAGAGMAATMLSGAAQAADAGSLYYERAFVRAADARCGLFDARTDAALASAEAQARGAALRAGVAETDLRLTHARAAARAAATTCGSTDLSIVAGRVKTAFAGWARTSRMTWPGDAQGWSADRTGYARPTWRLSQATVMGRSPVTFGYAATDLEAPRLQALVSFWGKPRPYAVRLILRDPKKADRAWLADGLPPTNVQQAVWASNWTAAPEALLGKDSRQGEAWTFPADAADRIAKLDPRERFAVQFLFSDDTSVSAVFEAGDFAAGRAFLDMGTL